MTINICRFIIEGFVQNEEKGIYKALSFSDESMEKVYEHFVLEYYRKHFKGSVVSNAEHIDWNFNKEQSKQNIFKYWPVMKTDVTLKRNGKTLIIDTKYYNQIMDYHYNQKYHSYNLYQLFTYVKNSDIEQTGNVSGMLLYAKTDESLPPAENVFIGGNCFCVDYLDLNQDFNVISQKLNSIIDLYLI